MPPLGVVGVCLGAGQPALAAGALLLISSNVAALVIASSVVLTGAGYASDAAEAWLVDSPDPDVVHTVGERMEG